MNKSKVFLVCAFVAAIELIAVPCTRAQEVFNAFFSVTCISTNSSGNLVYQHFGNTNLISQCAADEGLTNLSQLSLVFNPAAEALQVVTSTNNPEITTQLPIVGTDQFVVCTPLTFMNLVSLTGTNTNKIELLASVFVETNTVASGTLAATECFGPSSNSLTSFTLAGRIQYAVTASGTNAPAIYRGVLLVPGPNQQEEGEQGGEEPGENHGNNGNHGNGNNGNSGHENNGNHGNGNNGSNGNHGNGHNGHH
jgi:hypothetical protein